MNLRLMSYHRFFSFLLGLLCLGMADSAGQRSGDPFRKAITMQAARSQGTQTVFPGQYLSRTGKTSLNGKKEAAGMAAMPAPVGVQPCTEFTGRWSGSGNTWTSTTSSGVGVTITLQADPGAEWRTPGGGNDHMNTIDAWSEPGVQGAASFNGNFTWDTDREASSSSAADDASTGTITISFDRPVLNPVLHIDRIGGSGIQKPNSSEWTLVTSGASISRLAGVEHFVTERQRLYRSLAGRTGTSPSESSLDPSNGTAAGSVFFSGVFNELTFRLTGIGPEGLGADGFELVMCAHNSSFDFGDLPAPYRSTIADRGPAHQMAGGTATHYLGSAPDAENDARPNATADGDDSNNAADEDGIAFPAMSRGGNYIITADVTGAGGYLQGWIDWNGDGDFEDTVDGISERIALDLRDNDSDGIIEVPVSVPASATFDRTYARFRWSTVQGLDETTYAPDGEVEDYSLAVSGALKGTVFEDITGDALDDGDSILNDASGDQQGVSSVRVLLFRDGGDGRPDGNDDVFIKSTTTGIGGEYRFSSLSPHAIYWVAVDSRSSGLSDGTTWAEQTYTAAGGYCSDGSAGSTLKTSDGPCYGGRRGGQSDLLPASPTGTDLASAEHLIKAEITRAETIDKNFGFSFNVVTDVRDGVDDGSAGRTIQGSLRQFIQNANAIAAPNAMRFVPASSPEPSWWKIVLSGSLPAITGDGTTLDGTAYELTDGTTVRNTNTGSVGTGGAVGVDELPLPTYNRKELEIDMRDQGTDALAVNSDGEVNIREIAFFNNQYGAVTIKKISEGKIERNFIGARANGKSPGDELRINNGINITINSVNTVNLTVRNNYIAYTKGNGMSSGNPNTQGNFYRNEVFACGRAFDYSDGADVIGSWMIEQNLFHQNGKHLTTSNSERAGAGLEIGRGNGISADNVVRNNTMRGNEATGINILDRVINTVIEKNIIYNNGLAYNNSTFKQGAGIKLTFPDANKNIKGIIITQNSIYDNNGLGIDIVTNYGDGKADGVSANDGQKVSTQPNGGLDYPVFTNVTLSNNTLHVEGYVGRATSKIAEVYTIELFKAADDGNNNGEIEAGDNKSVPHGEGKTYLQSFTTNYDGSFAADVITTEVALGDVLTATATDQNDNTSEFSANTAVRQPTVSGTVYSDINHSGTRESGEEGVSGVAIVLLRKTGGQTCRSTTTDSDGNYRFEGVADGDYEIIEAAGQSTSAPGSCPPADTDPPGYISTTGNILSISVIGAPVTGKNFGDFNGSKVSGTVFNDDGTGGGTAHDGIQNGDETGIANTPLKLTDTSGNTLYAQATSNNAGHYTLWIADAQAGQSLRVVEENAGNDVSTGGQAGNTGGSYDRSADAVTFTPASGTIYNDVNFGDVPANSFNTDGEQNTTAGTAVFFPHTFTARSAGEVSFSTTDTPNPAASGWNQLIYRDANCNGEIDSGEQLLDSPVTMSKGQKICIVVRSNIPVGIPDGSSNTISVQAAFSYSNASPALSRSYTRTDLVHVTSASGAGLKIIKQVDRAEALPGETLSYSITYTNNSSEPLNDLKVIDTTPAYTNFASASCQTPLPDNLSNCVIAAPSPGQPGTVTWTFDGTLAPGSSGTVSYEVTIED